MHYVRPTKLTTGCELLQNTVAHINDMNSRFHCWRSAHLQQWRAPIRTGDTFALSFRLMTTTRGGHMLLTAVIPKFQNRYPKLKSAILRNWSSEKRSVQSRRNLRYLWRASYSKFVPNLTQYLHFNIRHLSTETQEGGVAHLFWEITDFYRLVSIWFLRCYVVFIVTLHQMPCQIFFFSSSGSYEFFLSFHKVSLTESKYHYLFHNKGFDIVLMCEGVTTGHTKPIDL